MEIVQREQSVEAVASRRPLASSSAKEEVEAEPSAKKPRPLESSGKVAPLLIPNEALPPWRQDEEMVPWDEYKDDKEEEALDSWGEKWTGKGKD